VWEARHPFDHPPALAAHGKWRKTRKGRALTARMPTGPAGFATELPIAPPARPAALLAPARRRRRRLGGVTVSRFLSFAFPTAATQARTRRVCPRSQRLQCVCFHQPKRRAATNASEIGQWDSEWEIGGYKSSRVCKREQEGTRRSSARVAPPGHTSGRLSRASRMRGGRSRPPWAGSPWAGTRGLPARGHRGGWGRGRGQGGWEVGWGASWGHEWRGHRGKRGAEVSGCCGCGCGCGCGGGGWQSPAGRPTPCEVGTHRSAERDPLSPQVRTPHGAPAAHRAFRGAGHAAPRGAAPGRFAGRKLVRVGGFLVNPAGRPPPSVSTAHTSSSRALVRRAAHRAPAPQARGTRSSSSPPPFPPVLTGRVSSTAQVRGTRSSSRPLAAALCAARRAPRAGAEARAAAAAAAAAAGRCRCAAGRGASSAAPVRAAAAQVPGASLTRY